MKLIIVALAASAFLTGCVSGSESRAHPPNYVSSQANQAPAIRNDLRGSRDDHARASALAHRADPEGHGTPAPQVRAKSHACPTRTILSRFRLPSRHS
jgi:hypothetical protein